MVRAVDVMGPASEVIVRGAVTLHLDLILQSEKQKLQTPLLANLLMQATLLNNLCMIDLLQALKVTVQRLSFL